MQNQQVADQMKGRQAPPKKLRYKEDYFAYTLDFLALAAGATANGVIQIETQSAFKWLKAVAFADIGAAALTEDTIPVPMVTVQIRDSGSGRLLFADPVPLETTFGTAQLPFILPVPRIFMQRSSISFTVENFSPNEYNLRLALHGSKIFPYGGSGAQDIV